LQGDVISSLPGDLGSAGRFLGFNCSIAGSLLGGLTSKPGQPGSVALGSARIASDADSLSGGLSFRECRIVCRGSRTKLLQFRPLRVRGCAQSVVKLVLLELSISLHLMRGSVGRAQAVSRKTTLGGDMTLGALF
jgi:hypothetical protein